MDTCRRDQHSLQNTVETVQNSFSGIKVDCLRAQREMQKSWKTILLVLSVGAVGLAAGIALRSGNRDLRTEGLKQLRSGDTIKGTELLEQHLKAEPSDHLVRKQLAENYARQGKSQQSATHLLYLSNEKETAEVALRSLAAMALNAGDTSLAEQALKKLLSIFPTDFAANLALGELYFNSGRVIDSIPLIEACIKAQPERAASYLLLADALSDAGRNQEMISPLETCIQLEPDQLAAHANLAYAYYSAGRSDEAIAEAQWCLKLQPDLHRVRLILAQGQRDNGLFDESYENIKTVVQAEPSNLDAVLLESDLLFYRGEGKLVYDKLLPFFDSYPEDRRLVSHLMRGAASKGDREGAKKWQQILAQLIPK